MDHHGGDSSLGRNSATETVKQELLFVGQECGKLIAIRETIRKVGYKVTIRYNDNSFI